MSTSIKKILLIKGFSAYDAVRIFMDELQKGFEKKGIHCETFDASQYDGGDGIFTKNLYPALKKRVENAPDFIISSSGLLLNNLKRCMEILGCSIPLIAYYVDHPFWEHERLSFSMPDYYTVFVDENFTKYANTYYQTSRAFATVHQAGILSPVHSKKFKDRDKKIVFFGSYKNSGEILSEIKRQGGRIVFYIEKILEYGKLHIEKTVEDIVIEVLGEYGIVLPLERFPVILSHMTMVEQYLRSYYRECCIKSLVDHGIEMVVYGDGWENLKVKHRDFLQVHSPVGYREMADIMTNYQYSLNVLPWAKAGFHDRLATSMLNGCVCISDTSTYLEEEKLDGEKMITYRLSEEQKLIEKLEFYMSSDSMAEEMAGKGQEYALKYHTWENRAEQFIHIMEGILSKS